MGCTTFRLSLFPSVSARFDPEIVLPVLPRSVFLPASGPEKIESQCLQKQRNKVCERNNSFGCFGTFFVADDTFSDHFLVEVHFNFWFQLCLMDWHIFQFHLIYNISKFPLDAYNLDIWYNYWPERWLWYEAHDEANILESHICCHLYELCKTCVGIAQSIQC